LSGLDVGLRLAERGIVAMPRYAIVEAPSTLGHVPEHLGVEPAPEVLLGAGLADGLAARRAGRVEAAGFSAERDPRARVMNASAISSYSPLLADAVTAVLDQGEFPVVLGRDCSILLGTMLALRRRDATDSCIGRRPCCQPGRELPNAAGRASRILDSSRR
jgi:arginase family enzyme